MPATILQDFAMELERLVEEEQERLNREFDFAALERVLSERVAELVSSLLALMVSRVHEVPSFLGALKRLGGRLGMRLKEFRGVRLRLGGGQIIEVRVPYFVKAQPKRGRKKRGPNGRGGYLSLQVLGFVARCSPRLISEVVELAVLCPSMAVAEQVLSRRGVRVDIKTIRRLCRRLGERGLAGRGEVSLCGDESLVGQTLVIGIDGGRVRERRPKRGRKPAGQRRRGYHTDWKEPKLFTLYVLDEQGQVVKEFAPLQDATMGDHEALFGVLERYLKALDLRAVGKVVFCGDGAPWIWSGVESLCARLGLARHRVYQVIDYTHAKQNLREIIDYAPSRVQASLEPCWKELLWRGDINALHAAICQTVTGKKKRQQALKKWRRYFAANAERMQYRHFQALKLPCGSGCVESAIRRVINLRLKAPGSFWTKAMAECFLFLRSQLLSGRWDIVMRNITRKLARLVKIQLHGQDLHPSCAMLDAA